MNISIRQATTLDADNIARFNALIAEETEQQTLESQRFLRGVLALLGDASN